MVVKRNKIVNLWIIFISVMAIIGITLIVLNVFIYYEGKYNKLHVLHNKITDGKYFYEKMFERVCFIEEWGDVQCQSKNEIQSTKITEVLVLPMILSTIAFFYWLFTSGFLLNFD